MRYVISTIAFLTTCTLGVAIAVVFTPSKSNKLNANLNEPSFGEMGCAKTASADATIYAPSNPQKPDYLVTSPDSKYDHGTPCPDQFIVEIQNTLLKPPFWAVGAEADGEWPDTELGCKAIRIEVAIYGLVPFYGWVKHYQYTVRGKWESNYGYWRCGTVYIDAPPSPIPPPHYYYRVRVATKVTTFFGKKKKARAGIVFG